MQASTPGRLDATTLLPGTPNRLLFSALAEPLVTAAQVRSLLMDLMILMRWVWDCVRPPYVPHAVSRVIAMTIEAPALLLCRPYHVGT